MMQASSVGAGLASASRTKDLLTFPPWKKFKLSQPSTRTFEPLCSRSSA